MAADVGFVAARNPRGVLVVARRELSRVMPHPQPSSDETDFFDLSYFQDGFRIRFTLCSVHFVSCFHPFSLLLSFLIRRYLLLLLVSNRSEKLRVPLPLPIHPCLVSVFVMCSLSEFDAVPHFFLLALTRTARDPPTASALLLTSPSNLKTCKMYDATRLQRS